MSAPAATVLLVGGHESHAGRDLWPYVAAGLGHRAVTPGVALRSAVDDALSGAPLPVCVVAMTLGRDPTLVSETARAVHWANRRYGTARVALAAPFGAQGHLVGWLRAAAGRHVAAGPRTAVLVVAPAAGPAEDADLYRVARLVAQYARHRWVEVAFDGGEPGIAAGADRCRRLGADAVVALPASFAAATRPVAGTCDGGPLLSTAAVAEVLAARVDAALHRLADGDDGTDRQLHTPPSHDHDHDHDHSHDHSHSHSHEHDDHTEHRAVTAAGGHGTRT